jgi:phenylalanyl-tRNA synthetase beta chain
MLLSLNWLREFVPYAGSGAELGEALTMVGLELDGLSRPYEHLRPIVVGHVVECGPHPESDHLSVCRVDVGDETLDIVCGAPNVAKGQKVAVAKVGVTLPDGTTIKKAKLRGQPSFGMICSERELGLSDEHDGIMVLDGSAVVGASLLDALGLDDEVLDVSVTPNRGDCLSVLGLAREVSAITGLPLTMPDTGLEESGPAASSMVSVEVLQPELCPLYLGRVIEGASVRRSPGALRYRLQSVGVRAISNLVDVTNYIVMELGQPLHAVDLDTIHEGRVLVRAANEGERFTTLDGQDRVLTSADITIRDPKGILCIGGVMGGLDSEITDKSTRVFLESAIFNPPNIRRTSRRLNLKSEAAFRFERGVDQSGSEFALNRASAMMARLGGGLVRPGVVRDEPLPWKSPRISLRKSRAEGLLGIALDNAFCLDTLKALRCEVDNAADSPEPVWMVTPPSYRRDLTREADLVEELARIYGVDRIPATLPNIRHTLEGVDNAEPAHAFISRVKHWGRGAGLHESVTYSFVSHKDLDHLGIPAEGRISIMNPLSDELNTLRTRLAPGLLNALRNNLAQGAPSVTLFECASTFTADAASETTARETPTLGVIVCGQRYESGWPQPAGDLDYLDLKGILERLLASFSLPAAEFVPARADAAMPWLAPCVDILVQGQALGFVGRVKPDFADPYHAKKPVWMAEINLEVLHRLHSEATIRFSPLPVFPPVRRDITFMAAPGITAGAIIERVQGLNSPLLSSVRLIDCFEPEGGSERHLTFRLTFRHKDKTLKDAEADKQRDHIASTVVKSLGVKV